jgi:hypothetical protein
MENNGRGRRTPTSLIWPVLFLGAGGLWLWLAQDDDVAVVLGATALAVTAVLGIVWLFQVRAARRFIAVVEAYAEQEIDRERRRNGPQQIQGNPSRGSPSADTVTLAR